MQKPICLYNRKDMMVLCRFYPGVADALRFSSSEVYIVTTKQVLPKWIKLYGSSFNCNLNEPET
jgi:hypothetical protein